MAQAPNQFGQTVEKGQVDLRQPAGAVSVIADSALVPGQQVKLVDSADGVPHVTAITAATDKVFGVVAFDVRRTQINIGDRLEVMFSRGNIVYMESSAAIARGADVMPVLAGERVATATAGNRILGQAYDKATAAGQLIRVILDLPGALAV